MEKGAISVNVDDALDGTPDERPIFGEPGADTGLWDECRLTALFPPDVNVQKVFNGVSRALGVAPPPFESSRLEDQDCGYARGPMILRERRPIHYVSFPGPRHWIVVITQGSA